MGFPACETFDLYYCETLWRAGELSRAREALETCLKVVGSCGMKFYEGCAWRLFGEVALAEGGEGLSSAARHLEKSMATLEPLGAENELALAWAAYGRVCQRLGERSVARDYTTRALATFERLGTRLEPERVRRTLAEIG
jgi:hypothetical protein